MSERRRMMAPKEELVWIRGDYFFAKATISNDSERIVSYPIIPVYAYARSTNASYAYKSSILLTVNKDTSVNGRKGRFRTDAYAPQHNHLFDPSGVSSGVWNVGFPESNKTLDVIGIGTVNNLYLYYSSDANRCLINDYAPGTIIYIANAPASEHRSWWYFLITKKDYISYIK